MEDATRTKGPTWRRELLGRLCFHRVQVSSHETRSALESRVQLSQLKIEREGGKEGREEGRKGGREEGRTGGREEGRKGGREEGRKEDEGESR